MFQSPKMMKLKLFIDKNSNKVLYAEAGKDLVDLLLHAFTMPLGYAIKNVFHGGVLGGLESLYTSVAEDMSVDYLVSGSKTKASLLNPNLTKTFYTCMYCKDRVSDVPGVKCPACDQVLYASGGVYVAPPHHDQYKVERGVGHVKALMTYLIADDLAVKPLSSSSVSMKHLRQLRVKNLDGIQESVVTIDTNQGMELVKASLYSKTVLTDTFLPLKTE